MLCKSNWIDISWGGLPKRSRTENLQVNFVHKAKSILPFDQACDLAAVDLYDNFKNLYLALSGGSDSENVANVLYRNRIPFTPIIIIYDHVVHTDQQIESWFAIQWCRRHKIEPLIVKSKDYINSNQEKELFLSVKPRLHNGLITTGLLHRTVQNLEGNLITGCQLEFYPDYEQMTYLEPQLGSYNGFVLEETDCYIEVLAPQRHPWALHYWSPEVMAAFVNEWNIDLTMQENKAAIYKVAHRPKMPYPMDMLPKSSWSFRRMLSNQFGTLDCALLGTKQQLLEKLVK